MLYTQITHFQVSNFLASNCGCVKKRDKYQVAITTLNIITINVITTTTLMITWFFSSSRLMVTGNVALELPVPNAVVKAFAMFQMNLKKVPDEPGTIFVTIMMELLLVLG